MPDAIRRGARAAWHLWRDLALEAGHVQTTLLLAIAYVAIVGPTALATRLSSATLVRVERAGAHHWLRRRPASTAPSDLARPF